jgi:hypothetical protein
MSMMTAIANRPLSTSRDALLRFAMRADATLTGLCGLIVAAAADPIAALTGLTPTQAAAVPRGTSAGLTSFLHAPRRSSVY